MASLSTDANGNKTIQLCGTDGKRRSIRLGDIPKKAAESVRTKVEHLHAMNLAKFPLDAETAAWIGGIGDDLHRKLAAVGLFPPRSSKTVGEFCDWFLAARRGDGETKPATVANFETVTNDVRRFFGESADLRTVDVPKAKAFRADYRTRKLAAETVLRRLTTVRMLFELAVAENLIPASPFEGIKAMGGLPANRKHYIDRPTFDKLIGACRSPHWKLVIALSRLAGLRCPSEVLRLRWDGIDLAAGSMIVHSPKTEHLPEKDRRVMPIFPAMRSFLESAERVGDYVVGGAWGDKTRAKADTPKGWVNCNLRSGFKKIIERAGLTPWPRIFHNLRASCETDLVEEFPIHVVAAWLGNTPGVATRHYLQVTESNFQKAVQSAGQSPAVPPVQAGSTAEVGRSKERNIPDRNECEPMGTAAKMGEEGLEPPSVSPTNQGILRFPKSDGSKAGGVSTDPRLAAIVAAFAAGPEPVRAALYAAAVATAGKGKVAA